MNVEKMQENLLRRTREVHELRNRIQRVLFLVEILQQRLSLRKGNERERELLFLIKTSLKEVSESVSETLCFRTEENPKGWFCEGSSSPFEESFSPLLVVEKFFSLNPAVKIRLKGGKVRGSEKDFESVIENLVRNAFEAGAKEVVLWGKLEGNFFILEVEDNGREIPFEVLPFLFLPGFSTKKNGSGIGLYDVYLRTVKNSWRIGVPALRGKKFSLKMELVDGDELIGTA